MAKFSKVPHIDPKPPVDDSNIVALLNADVVESPEVTPSILSKSQFEALRKARANARRERKVAR